MKKRYIVANWKSNKTVSEALEWLIEVGKTEISQDIEVIVCVSFPLLPDIKKALHEHQVSIKLGAQDISAFGEGAYTGEVNGMQIKQYVNYVLIGHSERRSLLGEKDELLEKKAQQAQAVDLSIIYCVGGEEVMVPQGVQIVAYEPLGAIGSGNPDTPENANAVAQKIKTDNNESVGCVLYGGSVTPENINAFTSMPFLDGVLIGGASLNAEEFSQIIKNA